MLLKINRFINFQNGIKSFKFLFTRAIFAYAVMYLLSNAVIDFDKIKFGLGLRQLNFMMPSSFNVLLEIEKSHSVDDTQKLIPYFEFYSKVIELMPQRADAQGMLGFCYYYWGDFQSAVDAYEKAQRLFPQHFWFYYNLGAIYYNLKNYNKAYENFKKASEVNLDMSYTFILNSREIYMPILKSFEKPELEAQNRLLEAVRFNQSLLDKLSLSFQNKPVSLPAQLVVRLF